MKLLKNSNRAVALITIIVSVIGLVMSPVAASTAFSPSGDPAGAGIAGGSAGYHHPFNSTQQAAWLQTVIANLSQQGVDVSQAQADIAAGNMTAAAQWLMAYHKDHPDLAQNGPRQHVMNTTAQAARVQTLITTLSQKGVNVSKALADLAAGNTTGAMKDLMALHGDHPGMKVNSTQQAARLQAGITKLGQQGVDVTEVQADLTSGNVTAALQWMAAYHKAHPVQTGAETTLRSGNSSAWQKGGSARQHMTGSGNETAMHPWFRGQVKSS
jgi:hypothetical protein